MVGPRNDVAFECDFAIDVELFFCLLPVDRNVCMCRHVRSCNCFFQQFNSFINCSCTKNDVLVNLNDLTSSLNVCVCVCALGPGNNQLFSSPYIICPRKQQLVWSTHTHTHTYLCTYKDARHNLVLRTCKNRHQAHVNKRENENNNSNNN